MSARRKAIRKAVRQKLLNTTAAGAKVYSSLSSAHWHENLPKIAIYTFSEESEDLGEAPKEYRNTLQLIIEILADGSEDPNAEDTGGLLEDVLDDIAEQVALELNRDTTLGTLEKKESKDCALVDELNLTRTEFEFRGDGSKPIGAVRMVYNAIYHEHRPGSIDEQDGIGELKTVNAKWAVGHDDDEPDAIDEAEDTVSIPQS